MKSSFNWALLAKLLGLLAVFSFCQNWTTRRFTKPVIKEIPVSVPLSDDEIQSKILYFIERLSDEELKELIEEVTHKQLTVIRLETLKHLLDNSDTEHE